MPHRVLTAAVVLFAAPAFAASPPIVVGFDRFHAARLDAAGGRLLLAELGCVACHTTPDIPSPKKAPLLDAVGARVRVGHLRRFLADPQAVKPGTTMPLPLAGAADRARQIEALVHFLASTGTPRHDRLDLKAIPNGRDLYSKVGCVACHGPRDAAGEAQTVAAVTVPLGDLKSKYSASALSAFLADPHRTRPAGRMPKLLSAKEAKDVACYLLQGQKGSPTLGRGVTNYSYYEGGWDNLPDLARLKPKATGTGAAFDLGVARRPDNYALRFAGVFRAERDGTYTFHVGSDDGSRVEVDGTIIADNDGLHGTVWKQGSVKLTKGVHKIAVLFFQAGGGAELEVRVEGPGLPHQDLAGLVAPTEADLDRRPAPEKTDDEDALADRPDLVAEGKTLFASAGCASCHSLHIGDKPVMSLAKAPPLAALKGTGGCLDATPKPGLPAYGLSAAQRAALSAALKEPITAPKSPQDLIATTLTTFNCYACHARAKVGGPEPALNAAFQTTQPEMGDEGRVPPPLDGVGAKLNAGYFRGLLDQGGHDRPYMHARMPGFGAANVGGLVDAFAAVDLLPVVPPVTWTLQPTQVRAAGRNLVGDGALACIKCHTFAGQKAEGVQGMDMILMPRRLRRDWFHAYVADPQTMRPGTRMPASYINGRSVLPKVLDGSARQQVEAMWHYLSEGPTVRAPNGLRKQSLPLVPEKTALIYRNFIAGSGSRAIAVGYPEKIHLAFDANDLRLALLWEGAFLDAARHWTDRGVGFEGPLGENIVSLPTGPAFAVLKKADEAWPRESARALGQRFLGYQLTSDDRPTFQYEIGNVRVEDFPSPISGKEPTLSRTLTLTATGQTDGLYLRAATGKTIEKRADGWFHVDSSWRLRIETGATPQVRSANGRAELLVPIRFVKGKARVVQEFAW